MVEANRVTVGAVAPWELSKSDNTCKELVLISVRNNVVMGATLCGHSGNGPRGMMTLSDPTEPISR